MGDRRGQGQIAGSLEFYVAGVSGTSKPEPKVGADKRLLDSF